MKVVGFSFSLDLSEKFGWEVSEDLPSIMLEDGSSPEWDDLPADVRDDLSDRVGAAVAAFNL